MARLTDCEVFKDGIGSAIEGIVGWQTVVNQCQGFHFGDVWTDIDTVEGDAGQTESLEVGETVITALSEVLLLNDEALELIQGVIGKDSHLSISLQNEALKLIKSPVLEIFQACLSKFEFLQGRGTICRVNGSIDDFVVLDIWHFAGVQLGHQWVVLEKHAEELRQITISIWEGCQQGVLDPSIIEILHFQCHFGQFWSISQRQAGGIAQAGRIVDHQSLQILEVQ